ncbi:permease [Paenibacillus sambharensis]|uniref:Permease n=1 Tax=Paenibacillus sambharensis TaxID=1803190 RepID=A0A2W1L9H9_9BACL|nr:DUF6198 family protein [Paenibacillus sambharensis]PZD95563.1 permease [Paenibacillus sambharensis]
MPSLVKRCLIYLAGLFILSSGVVLMIKSNVGIAPWDALNVALSERIGLTVGSWVFIVGGILIFVNSIIRRKVPNLAGLIPILIIGVFVDLLNLKLLSSMEVEPILLRWVLFVGGLSVLALGIVIYLRAALPTVPNDELMLAITERTGWGIHVTKTIGEIAALLLAVMWQGPVGLGTIIVVVCLGLFVGLFDQLLSKAGVPRSFTVRSMDE